MSEISVKSLEGKQFEILKFVEGITPKPVDNSSFDPKPFIRSFETSVDQLLKIKRKTSRKIEDLEDQTNASEASTKSKIQDINLTFDAVRQGFSTLEVQVGQVASTAVYCSF